MDASTLPVANVVGTTFLWKQIFCAVEQTTLTSPVSSPSSSRLQVQDTPAVAAAKAQHSALYGQIALSHAQVHSSVYTKLKSRFHIFSAGYSESQRLARSDPSGDTNNGHMMLTTLLRNKL